MRLLAAVLLASIASCCVFGQGYVIATMAGNGVAGFSGDNGAATKAQLNAPKGIAVDSAPPATSTTQITAFSALESLAHVDPRKGRGGFRLRPMRLSCTNYPLGRLIFRAYGLVGYAVQHALLG